MTIPAASRSCRDRWCFAARLMPASPAPAIVAEPNRFLAAINPVPGRPSTFTGSPETFRLPGEASGASVTLEPLYRVHGDRHYVVYWDLFTRPQWQARETEYAAEQVRRSDWRAGRWTWSTRARNRTSRDHKLEAKKSATGVFGNRGWRHADDGGYFRYVVRVLPDQAQELSVTYWGSDAGRRIFDILVDGKKLATETLENNRPDTFYDQTYALSSEELTRGKSEVSVTFQAHPRHTAGGNLRPAHPAPNDRPHGDQQPTEERTMKTLITMILLAATAVSTRADEWKLVWSDEFNEPGLPNPSRWGYEFGMIRNNERQFYTRARPENARVEDGKLIIERKEPWSDSSSGQASKSEPVEDAAAGPPTTPRPA